MAIAAKCRPEIDIEDMISSYELSGIPRSLFALDGSLLPSTDKSNLMHILEDMADKDGSDSTPFIPVHQQSVTSENTSIIDGMAIVHQLAGRQGHIKNCSEFSAELITTLQQKIKNYDSLHVVFDQYNVTPSLKEATRKRRTSKIESRHLICTDSTPIITSLATFITHVMTKASLTEYLSCKVLEYFKHGEKIVVVSTETGARSYHADVDSLSSSHEEADPILILHALHAYKSGSNVHIMSPDTDVFILALYHVPTLGDSISVIVGTGAKQRSVFLKPIYDAIGANIAAALLGFHSFTGCDVTGRFSGKGKITC